VYYVGKFCFNPVQTGQITITAQGNPTSILVLMDDQPDAWPAVTASTGVARASSLISNDPNVCNAFLALQKPIPSEFNASLPISTSVNVQENFRRNWYFAFVNCAAAGTDTLTVASYSISVNQGDGGSGTPLSCEKIGKYELFATYFSFSFIALLALLAFAKKLGIAIFSPSSPHALIMCVTFLPSVSFCNIIRRYALMVFTFGLIFVLADADSQRGSGNIVPQGRQSFGLFLLQVADWLMLTQAFGLCTGIVSIGHLQQESIIVKAVLAAFGLTYVILSIITVATDASMYVPCRPSLIAFLQHRLYLAPAPLYFCNILRMYNLSNYTDAQPINPSGVGLAVLRCLLLPYLGYTAYKSYQAEQALESKSFLKTFYLSTLIWQFIICICVLATINSNPFSQMISVWASTLTFNFLYLTAICFLLMSRWTDVPAGTKQTGKKQPFMDDDAAAANVSYNAH
jgi:hypothetical protein